MALLWNSELNLVSCPIRLYLEAALERKKLRPYMVGVSRSELPEAAQVGERFIFASEVYVDMNDAHRENSFNVFISHCWLSTNLNLPLKDHADDQTQH